MFADSLAKALGPVGASGGVAGGAFSFTGALSARISNISGSDFFGPQQPLYPVAPAGTQPRGHDYPFGWNLLYRPRSEQSGPSFEQLRWVADAYGLLRACIETRKDQICKMPYDFTLVSKPGEKKSDTAKRTESSKDITALRNFFESPDRENDFQGWTRKILEDMLVIDAASVLVRRDKADNVLALDVIDGATIKPLIDPQGRRPVYPDPSFQQNIKGMPAMDITTRDLVYRPRNPRTKSFYGYSPVEQILMTINIGMRREMSQLAYYTDGNVPEMLIQAPETWSAEQIRNMQSYWDDTAGDLAQRRRVRWIPGAKNAPTLTKEMILKDEMDEWLARLICYVFSLPPTPFVKQMNRAVANQVQETALQEGLIPTLRWLEDLFNFIIKYSLMLPGVIFKFKDDDEPDKLKQAQIDQIYLGSGKAQIDELRERDGEDPLGMPLVMTTPQGPILLEPFIDGSALEEMQNPPEPPMPVVAAPSNTGPEETASPDAAANTVSAKTGTRSSPATSGSRKKPPAKEAAKGLHAILETLAKRSEGGGPVASRPFFRY